MEKYLRQCLDSVVNQTLQDVEIIVINDGSTDGTLDIINEYAARDKRIRILDKPNEGYGVSMNRGLDMATGEYVGIVEPDDWIEPDMFETLYAAAVKHDVDVVKAEFEFFDNDTGVTSPQWGIGLPSDLYETAIRPVEYPAILWDGHPSIWTCIYRTKMLRDLNIRFAATPGASFQDMGFKVKTLISAARFFYIPKTVLHYRKHSNNSDRQNNKVFAVCDVHDDIDAWFLDTPMAASMNIKALLAQCRYANYFWNYNRLYGDVKDEFKKKFSDQLSLDIKANLLKRDYFDDKAWYKMCFIAHPYRIWLPLMRFLRVIVSPIFRTKISNNHKKWLLLNKVAIHNKKFPGGI